MTITTEEAETLAGSIRGASEMERAEAANALRILAAERDTAIARAEAAEEALAGALDNLSDASRARGEAEGKLAASEMAGIVEGWKTVAENNSQMAQSWRARAEKAEAEAEMLKAAFRVNALRWNPKLSHEEIDKFVQKVASGDKVLL